MQPDITESQSTPTRYDETDPDIERELAELAFQVKRVTRRQLASQSDDVYEQVLHQVESAMIEVVMDVSDHNLTRAAQRLGLSRPTLRSKLRCRLSEK